MKTIKGKNGGKMKLFCKAVSTAERQLKMIGITEIKGRRAVKLASHLANQGILKKGGFKDGNRIYYATYHISFK